MWLGFIKHNNNITHPFNFIRVRLAYDLKEDVSNVLPYLLFPHLKVIKVIIYYFSDHKTQQVNITEPPSKVDNADGLGRCLFNYYSKDLFNAANTQKNIPPGNTNNRISQPVVFLYTTNVPNTVKKFTALIEWTHLLTFDNIHILLLYFIYYIGTTYTGCLYRSSSVGAGFSWVRGCYTIRLIRQL